MARKIFVAAILSGTVMTAVGPATAEPLTYVLPEETAILRPGAGIEVAQNNCLACHSVDYIAMQPPKKGKAFWEAEVTKMIKTYHAPIDDADAKAISDYLSQTY